MKTAYLSLSPIAAALLLSGAGFAHAEERVVVSGNLLGDARADAVKTYPGSRSVISNQQLTQDANRSIDDALQRVPNVKVQDETGTGILAQVAVRGLQDSRSGYVQMLLDGIPLALAPYGQTGLSLFPVTFQTLDRIDVVRGGAAVQYGPNNVGGVINLISKPIPYRWQNRISQRTTLAGHGRNLSDTYISSGGMLNAQFGLQLEGNLVNGSAFREHSRQRVQNYRIKGLWNINDDSSLNLTYQYYDADAQLPGALSAADYQQDRTQSTRLQDGYQGRTQRLSAVYNTLLDRVGPFDTGELNWTLFGHLSHRSFDVGLSQAAGMVWAPDRPADIKQSSPRDFKVWGTEPRLTLYHAGEYLNQKFTLGARLIDENIDYLVQRRYLTQARPDEVTRDWKFHNQGVAGYLSDAVMLFDDSLTITPGIRFERVNERYRDNRSGQTVENRDQQWLPGLTLGYQATPAWFLYANAQKSLRAPQVTQIVKGDQRGAELAWNYESGVRYTPWPALSLQADYYRIDYTDSKIIYDNASASFVNLGRARYQGIEMEAFYSPAFLEGMRLHAGYAYLDSEQLIGANAGRQMPYASRHQLVLDGRYQWRDTTFALSGYYYSAAFSDKENTRAETAKGDAGRLPSYTVWNAQVTQALYHDRDSQLSGYITVNNLFNKDYYYRGIDTSPWGRQPAPGRSVTLGVDYTF
ncbi:TonB-dependent receptor family protein [Edwardsiella piscicida]|uniref:TonB-dependent receptor family protein n=1 Tax=Edwardsiella piscicida TaxID=1263550 RepID=UPI0002C143FE|nr:TonB-dependent siderophore receptor [Edwardsiella piscicida]AGH73925.1 Vibrioferrin receptor PvuA [Edwardsiella piscicida C07-087]EKS7780301.1 TonB-dependent siderophore receptor [Edwardsiella piscicida]EKS7783342.1 TonB-dependent siderophore receptor [Edwardsiella piscicida]UCQ22965.1 TonB-dependent siderophore receptor [Edwardsiella piscicida]UCQ33169.1 TonB-dependent siderophore receptor [Edwardsiella piscicida]